jgi:SAM-dependent methyltransferase
MSPIHQTAAVGFDRGAADYERGRPGYPLDAVEHLARVLGLGPGTSVLELGAGTGKFTRLLVGTGATVLAAEPVAGMRAELARALPDVERLDVPAEDTGLAPGSVDAVVAANAFHWFDGDAAIREMARILGTGGGVGVIWNRRDEADPIMRGISEIVDPYAGDALRFRSGGWRAAFERSDTTTPLERATFGYVQHVDLEGLRARVTSISYIASLDAAERAKVVAEVDALAGDAAELDLPYVTEVYTCRVR